MSVTEKTPHRGVLVLSPRLKLTAADLQGLREAGYIPLIGSPRQVKVIAGFTESDGTALNIAALKVCNVNDTRQREFGQLVLSSMIAEAENP